MASTSSSARQPLFAWAPPDLAQDTLPGLIEARFPTVTVDGAAALDDQLLTAPYKGDQLPVTEASIDIFDFVPRETPLLGGDTRLLETNIAALEMIEAVRGAASTDVVVYDESLVDLQGPPFLPSDNTPVILPSDDPNDCGFRVIHAHSHVSSSVALRQIPRSNSTAKSYTTAAGWESKKAVIKDLYMDQNLNLQDVMKIMEVRYNFNATYVPG